MVYRAQVNKDWWFWRPIVAKVISYTEALEMSRDQLNMINIAMDIQIEKDNQAMKSKGKAK